MYKLELKLRLKTQVFVPDYVWLENYFFSFYTDAQRARYTADMQTAITSGIMYALDDEAAYAAAGFMPTVIDTETNTLT